MRVLVIGSGQTGRKLINYARQQHEVYGTYFSRKPSAEFGTPIQLDKTRREEVLSTFEKIRPEVVVDTATLPGTEYMEAPTHREATWNLNVRGTEYLIDGCRRYGTLFIFVSTDYVFDGGRGNYLEEDPPNPINHYGRTKAEAERLIQKTWERHLIIRPSLIYSWDPELLRVEGWARNPSFAMWLINELRQKKRVQVISDLYSSPTLADNLASIILELAERGNTGMYHVAGRTPLSRFEFASKIAEHMGFDVGLIQPAPSSQFRYTAPRPRNTSLNVDKAARVLTSQPLNIDQALAVLQRQAEDAGLKAAG